MINTKIIFLLNVQIYKKFIWRVRMKFIQHMFGDGWDEYKVGVGIHTVVEQE